MKKTFIDLLAVYLLSPKVWGQIQGIIQIVEDDTKSGAEKKATALELIEKLGLGLAGWLLNLAIELAVGKLRV